MAKKKLNTLAQAVKELESNSRQYLVICIAEDGESGTVVSQGNPVKLAIALEKALEELKTQAVKSILSKILED